MTQAYRIRRHPNARRLTLKVLPDQSIVVVAPPRVSQRRIDQMVHARADWIQAAKARIERQQQARPPGLDEPFPAFIALPAVDTSLKIDYDHSGADQSARKGLHWQGDNAIVIRAPEAPDTVATLLIKAMKTIAQNQLEPQLHQLAEQHGYGLDRVSWRNQKSRWGSCRPVARNVGRISLNIRLLLLPPASARYVLLHELAHIKHPNHSPAFWQCVEAMQPDYRDHQQAIKHAAQQLPSWVLKP